jgi:pyridoxamine 5'-phosphate oxidase
MVDLGPSLASSLASLRLDYTRAGLVEGDLAPTPMAQFERWFREALAAGVPEANAATLATASPDGEPNARIVLLKGMDERGVTFFTNYESAKGRELDANPRAVIVVHFRELERQVRLSGRVARVSHAESEAYFHSRPEGSQLGAWASRQDEVVASREVLEASFEAMRARFAGQTIPLPPFWGGYRLEPSWVEMWQGRPSRMHDRLRYVREASGWRVERLSP